MKAIVVLVGPKGSGKSTLGRILASRLGIDFVLVEPLFLEVRARLGAGHPDLDGLGFEAVREKMARALESSETVGFESTGASPHFSRLLAELRELAPVFLVRVKAGPDQCRERVRGRDASVHIPVSDEFVEEVNRAARKVSLCWDAEIDNSGALDEEHACRMVGGLLGKN